MNPSGRPETRTLLFGEKATPTISSLSRKRTVPKRRSAPGGRGSLCRSVRTCSPRPGLGAALGAAAFGGSSGPSLARPAAGPSRRRALTPRLATATAIITAVATFTLAMARARRPAPARRMTDAESVPAAGWPAANSTAALAVPVRSSADSAAGAASSASSGAMIVLDTPRPHRASRLRNKSRARARRPATVPLGQPSWRAATLTVWPSR
jgi:hypothetical protein